MADANGDETQKTTWSVWPAQQRPPAAAAVITLILGVSWYGYVNFGHPVYSIIALVVLTGSLSSFLLPSTCTIDDEGIRIRGFLSSRFKSWDDLGCYIPSEDFIAVSTTDEPSHRSISRGFILRLSGNRDEVAKALSAHIPEWHKPAEDGE